MSIEVIEGEGPFLLGCLRTLQVDATLKLLKQEHKHSQHGAFRARLYMRTESESKREIEKVSGR